MRILTSDRVLFTGQHLCPELDCPQGPLPDKLQVLLCLLNGAERRRHLQAKLNNLHPRSPPDLGLLMSRTPRMARNT
jgi:hypothetical protein